MTYPCLVCDASVELKEKLEEGEYALCEECSKSMKEDGE